MHLTTMKSKPVAKNRVRKRFKLADLTYVDMGSKGDEEMKQEDVPGDKDDGEDQQKGQKKSTRNKMPPNSNPNSLV